MFFLQILLSDKEVHVVIFAAKSMTMLKGS